MSIQISKMLNILKKIKIDHFRAIKQESIVFYDKEENQPFPFIFSVNLYIN